MIGVLFCRNLLDRDTFSKSDPCELSTHYSTCHTAALLLVLFLKVNYFFELFTDHRWDKAFPADSRSSVCNLSLPRATESTLMHAEYERRPWNTNRLLFPRTHKEWLVENGGEVPHNGEEVHALSVNTPQGKYPTCPIFAFCWGNRF